MSRLIEESPLCSSEEEEVELASPGVRRGYRYWIAVPVALSVVLGAALVLGHDRDEQGGSFTIAKVADAISESSYVQTRSYKCNMKHEEALSKCAQAGSRRLTEAASEDCIPYKEHANIGFTGKEDEFDIGAEAGWDACQDKCKERAAADPPCKGWVFQYDGLCYVKYDLGTDPVEFIDEESPDTDAGMMCSEATSTPALASTTAPAAASTSAPAQATTSAPAGAQTTTPAQAAEEELSSGAGGAAATNERATEEKCRAGANKDYMACCASMPKQRCSFPCSETCQQRFGIMTSNYTKCCTRCPGGTCVDPWRLLDEFW